jgi:hypothetical protein
MKRRCAEPEISFTYVPRLPAGEYPAYCREAKIYRDRQYRRWVLAAQFDILDSSLISVIARLTWYLNLGPQERPRAGRRSNFWNAWVQANGGPPKRNDRLSARVFERRHADVRVADTSKTHNSGTIAPEESYSVVRAVVEWKTGGRPR